MEKNKLFSQKQERFYTQITYELSARTRATWGHVKNLKSTLSKKRISYSENPLINVKSAKSLKKVTDNLGPSLKKVSSCTVIGNNKLLNTLDLLQEKIKNAKRQIKMEKNEIGTKIQRKKCETLRKDISQIQSEEDAERQQKSLLSSYSVVVAKPCNLKKLNENPYAARGSRYFVSAAVHCINQPTEPVMQHINQTMQMLLQYKLIKMSQDSQGRYQQLPIILPVRYDGPHRKTVILDLDETLIHCFEDQHHNADIKLNITIDGNSFRIGINIRPYAISFLKKLKKRWEIIVFTASHQTYADCILDQIDPDRTLFDHRLYRQHCKQITENLYIKCLSRLNRNLSQTVLIDNAAYSYSMNLDNAIPIIPYYEGKDFELAALETYLQKLVECQDVRVMNRQYFQLHQYSSFDSNVEIVNYLYRKQIN